MNYTYAIEFETPGTDKPKFGHAMIVAPTAHKAVEEFRRIYPGADIRELRRLHGG